MNLANPEVDRNETLDPVAPPEVESTDIDSGPRGGQRPDVQVPDGDERTLSMRAGGQFLFWNLGPGTTASDWFGNLTIAWLFNPDAGRWNPYIPALGRGDFPLVDGLVLWLVSPVDQVLTLLLPAVQAGLQTAAANDFVIFRNTEVLQGTNTSRIDEPDAGNDRNAILYTGNWHAAASFDNGSSWSYINPYSTFSAPSSGGSFCCDQLVHYDDASGLLFWLLQYSRDGSGSNTVRIVVYEGRSALAAQTYCVYDYTPQDFGQPNSYWFDFNGMESSEDWLYLTSNVYQYSASSDSSSHQGGYVWRMELADFSSSCGSVSWQYYFNDDYYGIALADDSSTMYWGVHDGSGNNSLHIGRASDSSASISLFTRSISTFPTSNRGDYSCTAPDGSDPCGRFNRRLSVAWVGDSGLGFMWHTAQDSSSGWPFPHTRVAIFRTSDLTLTSQPHIWHESYAWVMPAVGVNRRGDIAGPIYVMEDGHYPRAQAFIWDDISGPPAPWENHTLRVGNGAPVGSGSGAQANGRYGDYGAAAAYDNCRDTWLGTLYTMQDGGTNDDAEHRFVWFGRERDGCSDLTITLVDFLSAVIEAGFAISITHTTANIGGITADSSFTRFYLSRDQTQSSNDLLLIGLHQVPSLGGGDSDTQTVTATVPAEANGDYFVIACADDTEKIDELTETNNCLASDEQLTVEGEPFIFVGDLTLESLTNPPRSGSPGGSFVVQDRVRFAGDDAPATVVRYYLDESRVMGPLSILFDVERPVPPFPIPLPNLTGLIAAQIGQQLSEVNVSEGSVTLVIPLNTPPGTYLLIACADGADQFDERDETNNCRASDLPISVGGGQGP